MVLTSGKINVKSTSELIHFPRYFVSSQGQPKWGIKRKNCLTAGLFWLIANR